MAPDSAMVSSRNINEEADRVSANWEEVIGARFKPTDEVLTGYYLPRKLSGRTDGPIFPCIKEVDVYEHEPSNLRSKAHDFGDGNMYFFSPVHMKYSKGKIIRRIAGDGCWKKSEKPSYVTDKDGVRIGTKTSLAYHKNDPKSGKATVKTQWLMKEFMLLQGQNDQQPKMALCVVYHHDNKRKQPNENLTCHINPANISRKRQRHPSDNNILQPSPPFDPQFNLLDLYSEAPLLFDPLRFNQFENHGSNVFNPDPSCFNSEEPFYDLGGTFMFGNDISSIF